MSAAHAASAAAIRSGLAEAHWTVADLWVASLGIGGSLGRDDVAHIADGTQDATEIEHDVLAVALNEHFAGIGRNHPVRYWRDLTRDERSFT